jgi:hypothetical protein
MLKNISVSSDPITLEKAKKVKKNLDSSKTKYVVFRCYEVEVE